jgi:hypothetical protein
LSQNFTDFNFYGFTGISAYLRGSFLPPENISNSLLCNSINLNGSISKSFNVKNSYHNNILNEKKLRDSISRQSSDKKVFFDKKHSSEKLSIALEKLMINNDKRKRYLDDKLQKEKAELILIEKNNAKNSNIMKNALIINKAKNAFQSKLKNKNDGDISHYGDDHNNENLNSTNNTENNNKNILSNYNNNKNNNKNDENNDENNSNMYETPSKLCDIYPSWSDHVNRRNPISSSKEAKKERLEYLNNLKNSQIQQHGITENVIKNILKQRLPKPKTKNQISSKFVFFFKVSFLLFLIYYYKLILFYFLFQSYITSLLISSLFQFFLLS